jgi:hypothetical protein
MTNFLENGTVMPHGLLSCNPGDFARGLAKSYGNTALRFGVIKHTYPVGDPNNVSQLSTEYDVDVLEQDMNRGVAATTYKNCLSVDSLGSIPDYFEKNFRVQTQSDNLQLPLTKGQNGPTVLVLCLDATAGKGVILGGLNHPDRPTKLTSAEPQLYGEYNGVAVEINPDGSTSLTFNGATNNDGDIIDPSQGTTTVAIATDGTFSVENSEVSITLDKTNKNLTLASTGSWTVNIQGDTNITTQGTTNIVSQGVTTVDGSHINLGEGASHAVILGDLFQTLFNNHVHPTVVGPSGPPVAPMTDAQLSQKTSTV